MRNFTPLDNNNIDSGNNDGPACCVCPHWDFAKRACLLVKEGLYLPAEQHVRAYCLSRHYADCHYLLQYTAPEDSPGDISSTTLNRRRFIRIPSRHLFRFSEITSKSALPGLSQDDAWTVDLSAGGLRFVSRVALPLQASIRFFLVGDAAIATMEGTGRVAWSEPLTNTPFFHTGLTFIERSIVE